MAKTYVGARLRRLREERGVSQATLARRLELSTSYVNQLENDQRPITVPVLLRLTREFELAPDFFAADGDARLTADLADILLEHGDQTPSTAEISELVARMPGVGQTLVALQRRLTAATSELESMRGTLGAVAANAETVGGTPFEQVRDYFYDRRNHLPELDAAAEDLFARAGLTIGGLDLQLARFLDAEYGIAVQISGVDPGDDSELPKRRYDPATATVYLPRRLTAGQRAFQLATQLALLSQRDLIDRLIDDVDPSSVAVARTGLANYFAGALLLPYTQFAAAARRLRYDVDLLARDFEVGFETVCHRLSTLQRTGDRGVPFIFVRVDKAGNISKRQSATAFHFSRVGGSCPLWVVHDAFSMPGRIHTQLARMPDGRTYFWLARTTDPAQQGHLATPSNFAVGLGCDLAHAEELIYATGVDLREPRTVVPIGAGCKVCPRPACSQRAFPMLGTPIEHSETVSPATPYAPVSP
ncbi:short-chain fatty acyl-CoA regulator family protein [Gordonia alkaliphila]|uniref:short-chain fatty acyl-CoA regulator family protein n=1 Tax=Gordonia alkaliphila TaxID=1053547 RepID=UPI001FF5986B|nr:short-chain fatty acyl-CoA regulator family protein [Gordonia alkaliphila]MCK0440049.1 short-chain fatty acyl-CoA regulator family protein [Gordonia alkaliphila]